MKKKDLIKIVFLAALFPLMVGTTYVIKEGGVEVGTWVEPDGIEDTQIIEDIEALPKMDPVALRGVLEYEDHSEKRDLYLERLKAQNWGIREDMTAQQVEKLARVPRYRKYTASKMTAFNSTRMVWVWEYRFKSKNYDHVKKVYFNQSTEINPGEKLVWKVENSSELKTRS